jgi:AAA ATPase containing von Willebrand factor type A (vWA) domain
VRTLKNSSGDTEQKSLERSEEIAEALKDAEQELNEFLESCQAKKEELVEQQAELENDIGIKQKNLDEIEKRLEVQENKLRPFKEQKQAILSSVELQKKNLEEISNKVESAENNLTQIREQQRENFYDNKELFADKDFQELQYKKSKQMIIAIIVGVCIGMMITVGAVNFLG